MSSVTNIQEIVRFYNKESEIYSRKRYPHVTESYVQYLFKKRRNIFIDYMGEIIKQKNVPISILEIGCADGVLFKEIEEHYPHKLEKMVGVDISEKMIKVARKNNKNRRASFYIREELSDQKFDIVVELGVHPFNLESEIFYIHNHLNDGAYFIYSVVGRSSLHVFFKMRGLSYVQDYLRFSGYEKKIKKNFDIVKSQAYALFIPKLWAIPSFGRLLQPLFDRLFNKLFPELFHEKIYLLKKKD